MQTNGDDNSGDDGDVFVDGGNEDVKELGEDLTEREREISAGERKK